MKISNCFFNSWSIKTLALSTDNFCGVVKRNVAFQSETLNSLGADVGSMFINMEVRYDA